MTDDAIRDILERSIDELPDELRTVFVACIVDGMTRGQFGEMFALTSEVVEARLHNARSLLVEVLIRQFRPAFGDVYPPQNSVSSSRLSRTFQGDINAARDQISCTDRFLSHA